MKRDAGRRFGGGLEGTKSATLAGLLGRVPVGYKPFPAHTIAELRLEAEKK
jgi:hypothetical protein